MKKRDEASEEGIGAEEYQESENDADSDSDESTRSDPVTRPLFSLKFHANIVRNQMFSKQ